MRLEKREFVDQKLIEVNELMNSRPQVFATQGCVVETWREYRGRRLGPYFQLSFRDGRQRSVYLGRSTRLAEQVRHMLREKQTPVSAQRAYTRTRRLVTLSLRRIKSEWEEDLKRAGLSTKGFEVRGWRLGGAESAVVHIEGLGRAQAGEPHEY